MAPNANAIVVEVIDGDTVRLAFGRHVETVRLVGVDTPETVDPNRPAQCFGAEATAFLRALLPPETPVRVLRDLQARDAFGRLLGYVVVADDNTFVNLELLKGGFGDPLSIAPNTTYRSTFAAAARNARRENLGLWGQCGGPDEPRDP